MKNKMYDAEVAFRVVFITVKATNKREATRKIKEKLKTVPAYKYIDNENLFIDER